MKLYKTDKKVISIKHNPDKFLNGLTANSLDKPRNAFCNIHGKIIATFDQAVVSEDEIYLVIEKDFVEPTLNHINKYAKLSGAQVSLLASNVYFDLEDCNQGLDENDILVKQKTGNLVITSGEYLSNVLEEDFLLFRVKNNIARLGVDYRDEFLLNIGEDEFVSFTKGCFLGQEPIAKVHYRSKPTWKLLVKYEDECDEQDKEKMTSKVVDPQNGRVFGFTFVRNF